MIFLVMIFWPPMVLTLDCMCTRKESLLCNLSKKFDYIESSNNSDFFLRKDLFSLGKLQFFFSVPASKKGGGQRPGH